MGRVNSPHHRQGLLQRGERLWLSEVLRIRTESTDTSFASVEEGGGGSDGVHARVQLHGQARQWSSRALLPAFSGSTCFVVETVKMVLDQEEPWSVRSNAASPIREVLDVRASRRMCAPKLLPFPTDGGRGDIVAGICCERNRFTLGGNLSGGWWSSALAWKREPWLKATSVLKAQIPAV